jgi:hypothetical protein
MLFTNLLASPWRWVLVGAAAILLAIAFGSSGLDYASTWWARRQAAQVVHTTEASHDARAAAEPSHRHNFDSTFYSLAGAAPPTRRARPHHPTPPFYTLAGAHREAVRAGLIPQARYDSLRRLFPAAVPELPAQPARYRPSH